MGKPWGVIPPTLYALSAPKSLGNWKDFFGLGFCFVLTHFEVLCLEEVAFLETEIKDFTNTVLIPWKWDSSQIVLSVFSAINILL